MPIVEYLLENGADVDAQDLGNASGKRLAHLAMVKPSLLISLRNVVIARITFVVA